MTTSLTHALTNAEVRTPASAERIVSTTLPTASDEAIRLALQLRDTPRPGSGGRLMLFVPVCPSVNASLSVADALCGLQKLNEGPVLVMDLRQITEAGDAPAWLRALPEDDDTAAMTLPLADRRERVSYAASREFAAELAAARSRYAYVLCIGGTVSTSVETLIVATLADGVVLAVAPNGTTRPHVQHLVQQLRRARANLIGFVVDSRSPLKRAER